jgi:hypothetical protein
MERKTSIATFDRKMRGAVEVADVQHTEAGVFNFVQVAAVRSQFLDRLSEYFFPKGVAQPGHDLKARVGRRRERSD